MPCKIFPFCKLRNHKNLSDCYIGRDAYYGYNTGQEVVLVCPTCLILCHQNDDKNIFYQLHQLHIGRLSKADKYLIILKAQIKEYKTSPMKHIPLNISNILNPTMKLGNIDLNDIQDLLTPSLLDNNEPKEFQVSNISTTSVVPLNVIKVSTRDLLTPLIVDNNEHKEFQVRNISSTSVVPLNIVKVPTQDLLTPLIVDNNEHKEFGVRNISTTSLVPVNTVKVPTFKERCIHRKEQHRINGLKYKKRKRINKSKFISNSSQVTYYNVIIII